eukprot:CAMPEP_0174374356 /NCGR_PEP_ID=MMETSP0811_2-20130205/110602_1 /TAXON_ID=73025 ORGANISM="Eutreptiella gymnastica-like, Strain CCMP1594" /NCGR_SAMPLE_ID=MMETSP0811_2 /ASSEMBLY_ACC=CAM_ASM_000667 /LENGTH=63 /DNA_ID=CAMNT_0015523603 /DNA_START=1397 /DNA_END=1584 /DNA_ORIENTATION=+
MEPHFEACFNHGCHQTTALLQEGREQSFRKPFMMGVLEHTWNEGHNQMRVLLAEASRDSGVVV